MRITYVLQGFAVLLIASVDVQVTVIVLQVKCATPLIINATLLVWMWEIVVPQIMALSLVLAVHLAYAAVLIMCVDVQVTVIVLQVKCATPLRINATLVVCR